MPTLEHYRKSAKPVPGAHFASLDFVEFARASGKLPPNMSNEEIAFHLDAIYFAKLEAENRYLKQRLAAQEAELAILKSRTVRDSTIFP